MVTVHEELGTVSRGDAIACRAIDGSRIVGECASLQRDQAGLRATLCPVDASRRPYRVCQPRSPRKWRRAYIERWNEGAGEWVRYGELVEFEAKGVTRTD